MPAIDLPTPDLQYGPYSPSRIDTANCGHAFYESYVLPKIEKSKNPNYKHQREPENLAAARGSVIHEVFELVNAKLIQGSAVFSNEEIRKWVREAVHDHPIAFQEMELIVSAVHLYIQRPPKNVPSDAMIEQKLALDMDLNECDYDDPKALIRGRADLMWFNEDMSATILDFKTQPNIEEADTFQMGVYAFVVAKTYNLKEVYTQIYFARYGKYSQKHLWTEESLALVEERIKASIEVIEWREKWEATPHNGCQYCPFITSCPVFKDTFNIDPESGKVSLKNPNDLNIHGNLQQAIKVAAIAIQLKEFHKVAESNLREFARQYGQPIVCNNKAYMFKAKEEVYWDKINKSYESKSQIIDIMVKHGVDYREYIGFSNKVTLPVLMLSEDKPEMAKELGEKFVTRATSNFSVYKV